MQFETTHDLVRSVAQDIVIFGGSLMAIAYGLRRVYRMARNVETIMKMNEKIAETAEEDAVARKEIADSLVTHIALEEAREKAVDEAIRGLIQGQNEILREVRPNGGSSIKDVVNSVQRDVAVLKQWKDDTQGRLA